MTNQFGLILDGYDVEQTVMNHLRTWMPDYLGEMERKHTIAPGTLRIRSFLARSSFDRFPEDQLPMILIVSPGLAEKPWRAGRIWHARWLVRVTTLNSAKDRDSVDRLSKIYIAAVRSAILQHRSLGGKTEGVDWINETYTDVPSVAGKTLASAQAAFSIQFANVTDEGQGITTPQSPPIGPNNPPVDPGPWPVVQTTEITINNTEAVS